jgi:hypothetical protein
MTTRALIVVMQLVVVACAPGPASVDHDAGAVGDATAPVDAAARGPITLTIVGETTDPAPGEPLAGVEVYLVAPDGAYVRHVTGEDGRVVDEIDVGAAALVVRATPTPGTTALTAYLDLAPGLDLVAGAARPTRPPVSYQGSVDVVGPTQAGAGHALRGECLSLATPLQPGRFRVSVDVACPEVHQAAVVAEVRGATGEVVEYSVATVDLIGLIGGTYQMPAGRPPAEARLRYSGVTEAVELSATVAGSRGGPVLSITGAARRVAPPGVELPLVFAPTGDRTTLLTRLRVADQARVVHLRRTAPTVLIHAVDLGQVLPHAVTPVLSLAPVSVAWTTTGGAAGRRPDLAAVRFRYDVSASGTRVLARIIGDGVRDRLAMPPLPPELAALVPHPADLGELELLTTYDVIGRDGYLAVVRDIDQNARAAISLNTYPAVDELWSTEFGPDVF